MERKMGEKTSEHDHYLPVSRARGTRKCAIGRKKRFLLSPRSLISQIYTCTYEA